MSVTVTVDGDKRDYNYHLQSSGATLTGITYSGLITQMVLGGTEQSFSYGDALYVTSSGRCEDADADVIGTMPVFCLLCEEASTDDEAIVLLQGFFRDTSKSWTVGGLIYASVTPGTLSQTAPVGTGDQVQVVGIATDVHTMYFKPDYTIVQI